MAIQPTTKPEPTHEVLGFFDINAGLPEGAMDAVPTGIPDAFDEPPSWQRRTALDRMTPKPRTGYVQRWVRIATADGRPDVGNKAEALSEGWRPRRADTLGKDEIGLPVYDAGDGKAGVIIFKEQLLLCEMKTELHDRLVARLNAEQERINRAVYQQTKEDSGLPSKYARLDYDARESADLID